MKLKFFLKSSCQDSECTLKNILFLNLSTILTNLAAFATSVIIGRYLEKQDFGKFVFIFAFLAIFDIFTDLGLSQLAVRDVSQDKNSAGRFLINISFLKSILCIITIVCIWLVAFVLGFSSDIRAGLLIVGLSIILQTFGHFFGHLFNAFERMEYTAIFSFLLKFLTLIGIYLVIRSHLDLASILWVYPFSAGIFALISLTYLRKKFIPELPRLESAFCRKIILKGLPFALFMFFSIVYTRIDVSLLKVFKGDYACAVYEAANYILMAIMFIPANLSAALYPVFSRLYGVAKVKEVGLTYQRYFYYLFILALAIGLGMTLLSKRVVLLVWTARYGEAAGALRILAWGTAIQYLTSILSFLMLAVGRQRIATLFIFFLCIFNILLNLVLIPNYSYIGSCIARLISMVLYFFLFFRYVSKYIYKINLNIMIKPLLAAIFMGVFIYIFQEVNLFLLIFSSAFLYISFLFIMRAFKIRGRFIG